MAMHSMELRRPPLRGLRALGVLAAIAGAVALMALLAGWLSLVFQQAVYLAYASVFLLAVYVYRRFVVEYRYTLTKDGAFVVERLTGSKARVLFAGDTGDIAYYGDAASAPAAAKTRRFLLSGNAGGSLALVLREEDGLTALHIAPDEKMHELLTGLRDGTISPANGEDASADEAVDSISCAEGDEKKEQA